jgi:hypothetical protein
MRAVKSPTPRSPMSHHARDSDGVARHEHDPSLGDRGPPGVGPVPPIPAVDPALPPVVLLPPLPPVMITGGAPSAARPASTTGGTGSTHEPFTHAPPPGHFASLQGSTQVPFTHAVPVAQTRDGQPGSTQAPDGTSQARPAGHPPQSHFSTQTPPRQTRPLSQTTPAQGSTHLPSRQTCWVGQAMPSHAATQVPWRHTFPASHRTPEQPISTQYSSSHFSVGRQMNSPLPQPLTHVPRLQT